MDSAMAFGLHISKAALPSTNFVGVDISNKSVQNDVTEEMCIKIYVRQKFQRQEIATQSVLPTAIDGILTDVEEVGEIWAFQAINSAQRFSRLRPAPCGVSVGHYAVSVGTIGAVVRDSGRQDNGRRYILSNNHVLANSNNASIGDPIFQPGGLDGGIATANRIGALRRFVPLKFDGRQNTVDCAIAEVDPTMVMKEVCSIGVARGTVLANRTMVVSKHGRTTGLTYGVITDVDADIKVAYDGGREAIFANTIVVRGTAPTVPFSEGGDSGSLILDSRLRALGLLFAGASSGNITFANPIPLVLRRLQVRLA